MKWRFFQCSICFYFLLGIISLGFQISYGVVNFTQVPPSVLYVSNGGTAKFVWDYHVDDRDNEFYTSSPEWSFINNTNNHTTLIAAEAWTFENGGMHWKWSVAPSCPARLQNRVSKESTATLVINNVNMLDNGNYSCKLVLSGGKSPIERRSKLIVTVSPQFNSQPPQTKNIIEGENLILPCTAIGPPTPNITWVKIVGHVIKNTGTGSATLRIPNIKRGQSGAYECQAWNNPNEKSVTVQTLVTVYYPPEINKTATLNVLGCIGREVRLFCKASGSPTPSMKWIDPNDKEIFNVSSPLFKLKDSSAFGNYTCTVNNSYGSDSYVISLTEGACTTPTPKTDSISDVPAGIIAGVVIAGVLAIAGLIIALIFCYRRKSVDRDSFRSGAQQERTVQMSSLHNQEEQYASVQHQQNRGSSAEPIPRYAVVDKNKKKKHNPDGLIYADLDLDSLDNLERRPSSGGYPTIEAGSTVYADIAGDKKHHPEPQYGNLQAKDLSI